MFGGHAALAPVASRGLLLDFAIVDFRRIGLLQLSPAALFREAFRAPFLCSIRASNAPVSNEKRKRVVAGRVPRGSEQIGQAKVFREKDSSAEWRRAMPRGDKSKYTDKQIRKADDIEASYRAAASRQGG